MSDDDLKFLLTFNADTKPVEDALADIGKNAAKVIPVPSREYQDFADALADAHERATKELIAQKKLFQDMSIDQSLPKLKEQVELEKKITEMRHRKQVMDLAAKTDPASADDRMRRELGLLQMRQKVTDSEREGQKQIAEFKHKQHLLELKGDADPAAVKDRISKELELLKARRDVTNAEVEGQKEVAELRHKYALSDLRQQLDPRELKRTVGNDREMAEAQRALDDAKKAEYDQQEGTGAVGQMGEMLDFAKGGGKGSIGKIGEGIGAMVGGSLGSMLGEVAGEALQITLDMQAQVLAAPAKLAEKTLGGISRSLKELGGQLGPVGMAFDVFSAGVGAIGDFVEGIPIVGEYLGPMLKSFGAIPGIFKEITSTLTTFAGVASPAQLRMFTMAVEDVQGVIGQRFLPILKDMREYVILVGDAFANFLPSMGEVEEATAGLRSAFAEMRESVRELMVEVGPLLKEGLKSAISVISDAISFIVRMMTQLYRALSFIITPIRELLGIAQGTFQSSQGAAARQASITSFDSYQEQLQVAAYSNPGSTMESVPSTVTAISTTLNNISNILSNLTPQAIGQAVANAIRGVATSTTDAVKDTIQTGWNNMPAVQLWNYLNN